MARLHAQPVMARICKAGQAHRAIVAIATVMMATMVTMVKDEYNPWLRAIDKLRIV